MSIDQGALKKRADDLLNYARETGFNSIERDMELLPKGDLVARVGYLANALGVDFGTAFDQGVDVKAAVLAGQEVA